MTAYRILFFVTALLSFSTLGVASSDSLIYNFNFSDTTKYDASLSSDIDFKTEPGKLILGKGDNKNLSFESRLSINYAGSFPQTAGPIPGTTIPDTLRMNPRFLKDDNYFTVVSFPLGNIGSQIKVDFQAVRRIRRIQVANLGATSLSNNQRPLAFSYYAGVDSNKLSKIYQELDNQDSVHTAFLSESVIARYLNFVLDKQSVNTFTVISEMKIYGEGFLSNGLYVSKVDSLPSRSNFASVFFDADFETATSFSFEIRTGATKTYDSTQWSSWSAPLIFSEKGKASAGELLKVSEPRKYFQYRIKLISADLGSPKISSLKITYQTSLVADSTSIAILPQEIPVLSPVTLSYTLQSSISGSSLGIDTIIIITPSPSVVRSVTVNGSAANYSFFSSPDKMTIAFPSTLNITSTTVITFSTKMIQNGKFPSYIISKQAPWNPQSVEPSATLNGESWDVNTTGIPAYPLIDVRIDPNPFTPNGDGKNDATIIDFSVANVEIPKPLRITIYDLSGKKIRSLLSISSAANPFFGDPRMGGKGFLWDGKNDDGRLVLPGIYILQVTLDIDNGGFTVSKSVVVSY